MGDFLLDARYALRVLWKSPAFTSVVTLTLALAIGANVAVFGVVDAMLLRPLDVKDPDNLYQVRLNTWASGKALTTSYPAFEDLRRRNTTFSALAGFNGFSDARLRWGTAVKRVTGHGFAITANYFEFLGAKPQIGRLIQPSDDHGPNSAPYMVLSDSLWRTAFNANPAILGTTVRLGKDIFTVVGVASQHFHGTERFDWPDYWIPLVNYIDAARLQDRTARPLTVLGRLKPGVTRRQAVEDLSAIAANLAKEYPKTDTGLPLRLVRPGLWGDTGDVIRAFLYGVTGLALLVLVAACANLASLFAARAAYRNRELAVRVALGASPQRLVRQLMTEAMVVSTLAGAAALMAASMVLAALSHWHSPPGEAEVSVDTNVYLATLLLAITSGVMFGIVPALRVSQTTPLQAMKSGPLDAAPLSRFGFRDFLLVAQIAICTILVTSSLVAIQSMMRALHTPLGFEPRGAIVAQMDFSELADDVPLEKKKQMIEALRTIPGVSAAAMTSRLPFNGGLRGVPIFAPDATQFTLDKSILQPYSLTVSPEYFNAAGTRLLSGRDFSWHDGKDTPRVAIVNASFARKMWRDEPAIGRRFIVLGQLREVVGVVEDNKYNDIGESPIPAFYLPLPQDEAAGRAFIVRSLRPQKEVAVAIEHTLTSIEPSAGVNVQSWPEAMALALFPARAAAIGLGAIALVAATLAATGIFGMAAYNVSRRMKELGIRLALGARTNHVLSSAVGRPVMLLAIGSAVGLVVTMFGRRLLEHIVFQPNPRDPVVAAGAVLMMALLGTAASIVPALRALAVDPSKLMREE